MSLGLHAAASAGGKFSLPGLIFDNVELNNENASLYCPEDSRESPYPKGELPRVCRDEMSVPQQPAGQDRQRSP